MWAQNSRPVPRHVPVYEFFQYDTAYHGYYLTTPFKIGVPTTPPAPTPLIILDAEGYVFWYMPVYAQNVLDFKYVPEQQRYLWAKFYNAEYAQYMVMDTGFQLVDSLTTVNGIAPDVHDFQLSKDNTYLLAGLSDSIMDLSGYFLGGTIGSPTTHALGFVVQEFDQNHQLLYQWDSNDHIHPAQAYAQYGYSAAGFDYCHGNSIAEDLDGGLLLSFRHLNAVYKVDRKSGKVVWTLGGKSSSFTFPNDPGFSGQHDARALPNGNIALFDNANSAPLPKRSRAVEYQLDTINWVATKVWEYQYSPPFFSIAMGNHQTTDDRLHLINYGLIYRPKPTFALVDDAGKLLSELFFQDSFMSYRSFIFDIPADKLQRPVISCAQDGANVTLSAPPGFDRYEWSTGETGTSIQVQNAGTYQLWVNQGEGMLGSRPFVITDPANACPVSGTDTPQIIENKTIAGLFDLLGRPITIPEKGQIYVARYADGRAQLRFWEGF